MQNQQQNQRQITKPEATSLPLFSINQLSEEDLMMIVGGGIVEIPPKQPPPNQLMSVRDELPRRIGGRGFSSPRLTAGFLSLPLP